MTTPSEFGSVVFSLNNEGIVMYLLLQAIGVILVAALNAFPAFAAQSIMRATVTGIIGPNTGYDASGVFGNPGTDLIGAPFVVTFTTKNGPGSN